MKADELRSNASKLMLTFYDLMFCSKTLTLCNILPLSTEYGHLRMSSTFNQDRVDLNEITKLLILFFDIIP